ncbi:MAG: regulatory protein MerR [Panacagrimonas sp.]|nr:helix-turn-helix domain-containing protein [Panacagrimonas sp.]MCC2659121.1 regulatory protein MerR [Panacagrimonas sp.]
MDISQVAKQTGVPASTLRYYEKQGLLVSLNRQGARRMFAPSVIQQLGLIALGQAAGFSLQEIKVMLTPGGRVKIDRSLLSSKAQEVDILVKQLQVVSRGLRHAAACPAPSHAECPTFRRLLRDAASGALRQAPKPLVAGAKRASSVGRASRARKDE